MKEILKWLYRLLIIVIAITASYLLIIPSYTETINWFYGIIAFLVITFLGLGVEHLVREF